MMYFVRTITVCLTSLFLFAAPALQSQPAGPEAQLRTFAACVGRLSAVLEHEWNIAGSISESTKAQRDAVVEIVAAIVPRDRSRDVLYWRNAAKQAQSSLLARANFATDGADAAWADAQAKRYEHECTALLTL